MSAKDFHPCSFDAACHILWAVQVLGWSQTKAAIVVGVNVGTVNHVVHGRRYPEARPKPIPGYRAA